MIVSRITVTHRPMIVAVACFVWLATLSPANGQAPEKAGPKHSPAPAFSDEDLAFAKECFDEAKTLSDNEGGKLWGKKLYGPFLFVDPGTRNIISNGPDKEGQLSKRGDVWVGRLPESENIAFTAYDWAGVKWTMIAWPPQKNPFIRARLHTHEMFHRIQAEVGLAQKVADNQHLDSLDGRLWMRAEWRAIRKALGSTADEQRAAIEDALVFRRYRQSLFPDHVADELAFEMHEGMAEYTGFIASGMPEPALPQMAGVQLAQYDKSPALVLTFAYASGPAYGVLLDAAGAKWREGASPNTDLGELLRKAYRVKLPSDLAQEATKRIEGYDGKQMIEEETKRAEELKRTLALYQMRFADDPILTLPSAGKINWAYDPRKVVSFGDVGKVYETGRITDHWGVLEVPGKGMLLVFGKSGGLDKVIVPAPAKITGSPITGDDWTLTLADGWALKPGKRKGDYIVGKAAD